MPSLHRNLPVGRRLRQIACAAIRDHPTSAPPALLCGQSVLRRQSSVVSPPAPIRSVPSCSKSSTFLELRFALKKSPTMHRNERMKMFHRSQPRSWRHYCPPSTAVRRQSTALGLLRFLLFKFFLPPSTVLRQIACAAIRDHPTSAPPAPLCGQPHHSSSTVRPPSIAWRSLYVAAICNPYALLFTESTAGLT